MSNINPLGLIFLLAAGFAVLGSSRQNAVRAFLATALFMPLGQKLVIGGLNFHFFRLLLLAGFCRVITRREAEGFTFTRLDKVVVCWALVGMIMQMVRDRTSDAVISGLGFGYNTLGTYFLIRLLIKDVEDFVGHLRFLSLLVVPLAAAMAIEMVSGRNMFYIFGGVPQFTGARGGGEGSLRCQGPFLMPILTGSFGSTLFPLMICLWFQGAIPKWRAALAVVSCFAVTGFSHCSGPVLILVTALIGLSLWPLRSRMRLFRRSAVVAIIGLHIIMKAPVWFLIARASDLVGGSGWHRSYLIDQFIGHFSEWWLVGTSYTAHWGPGGQALASDPNNMDLTNEFVVQGVHGGVLQFGLFLVVIALCFKNIGRSLHADGEQPLDRRLLWMVGVTVASHCVAFISISYFDQIQVFWLWLLAAIAGIPHFANSAVPDSAEQAEPELSAFEEETAPVSSAQREGQPASEHDGPDSAGFNKAFAARPCMP